MLLSLLLLYLGDDSSKMPDPDKIARLEEIFDIRIGLVKDRYLERTKETGKRVHFINLKAFTDVRGKSKDPSIIGFEQWNPFDPFWIESLHAEASNSQNTILNENTAHDRVPVKDDKVLLKSDYLITIRGMPFGYSFLNNADVEKFAFVPTHHFIRLRPLDEDNLFLPYFHLLLDHLVEFGIAKEFNKKVEVKGKKIPYAHLNSIKVEDLKAMQINYHSNFEDQQKVYENYREKYDKWQQSNLAFYQYQMNFFNKIS